MNCPYCLTKLKVIELEYPETDDILDTVVVTVSSESSPSVCCLREAR